MYQLQRSIPPLDIDTLALPQAMNRYNSLGVDANAVVLLSGSVGIIAIEIWPLRARNAAFNHAADTSGMS